MHETWMQIAIDAARSGIAAGQSPFGAVIVQGDRVIASGHNEVWKRCDPTAHAEVVTIQRGSAALQTIDFAGCVMYTTCEPCPMCAAAIHWSKLDAVYYGATIDDAKKAGFNELTLSIPELYRVGGSRVRLVPGIAQAVCAALFDEWLRHPAHRAY